MELRKIKGHDLQKGRVSENKFDMIIENGRYFDDPIKNIVKKIHKKLESMGYPKESLSQRVKGSLGW